MVPCGCNPPRFDLSSLSLSMEILRQLQAHLPPLAVDVVRLSIWLLLLMVIFVPLEKVFAVRPHKVFRKSFPTDLGYYFLNSLLPKMILVLPMALIAWGLHYVVPGALHSRVAGLPWGARLTAALVVGEIGFYWGHRWMHEVPLLWRFHAIHHSAEEVDWLVNTRAHPFDIIFVRLCGLVPMYALGLAQPTMGKRVDVVPLLILLVAALWGFFIHANVRCRFGWLEWLISTPGFHHWHHTNDEHTNKNYASMLPWMDIVFGTWYMPKKQWPTKYGIDAPMPPSLTVQLLQPFLHANDASVPTAAVSSTAAMCSHTQEREV